MGKVEKERPRVVERRGWDRYNLHGMEVSPPLPLLDHQSVHGPLDRDRLEDPVAGACREPVGDDQEIDVTEGVVHPGSC